MATAANGYKNLENKNETRIPLTPTGLLMEGDLTSLRRLFAKKPGVTIVMGCQLPVRIP